MIGYKSEYLNRHRREAKLVWLQVESKYQRLVASENQFRYDLILKRILYCVSSGWDVEA